MREPSPRSIKSGSPPTERKARTGLLTPPGMRLVARAMRRAERSFTRASLAFALSSLPCNRVGPFPRVYERLIAQDQFVSRDTAHPKRSLLQPAGHVRGVVGDDDVCPGTLYSGERLHHGALFVEPAVLCCGLEHRVLAADVVRRDGQIGPLAHPAQDVQVWQGGLDHDDVRALLYV